MEKPKLFFLCILMFCQACQSLAPSGAATTISACSTIVSEMNRLQAGSTPDHLLTTGQKRGDELDVNGYFTTLTHISMREGFALDYVYQNDDLGGYPLLYPRPVDQAPYVSTNDLPADAEWPEFRDYLEVEDTEQGYFEYVVMDIMANQFYLFWHANYND